MSAVMKVASYSSQIDGVTKNPLLNVELMSNFSTIDSDAPRTGSEMLSQPPQYQDLKGSVTYPMWDFQISGVPLSVTVTLDDDTWIASIEALDIFGDGSSVGEALSVLGDHLANNIEFYRAQRPANLTEFAKCRRTQLLKIEYSR